MADQPNRTPRLKFRYPKNWKLRAEVHARDGFRCVICGREAENVPQPYDGRDAIGGGKGLTSWCMEIDHIVPRDLGGSHDINNLQTLCHSCNARKRNRLTGEY